VSTSWLETTAKVRTSEVSNGKQRPIKKIVKVRVGAEEHDQHHGRSAELVCLRSNTVAREVELKQVRWSGAGQGVAGTWKDLTDNVNSMAGNHSPGARHR